MVIARCAAFVASLVVLLSARADPLPAYRVGDTASADIIAPVQLIVIDRSATEALKQREALKVPVIFRFHTNTASLVEEDFNAAVSGLRSNFLSAMKEAYPLTKVTARNLPSQRFRALMARFRSEHGDFPLSTNLVRAWALGEDDREIFQPFAGKLCAALQQPVRTMALPAGLKLGPQVRLVALADAEVALTLAEAGVSGKLTARTNLLVLNRVRQDFPKEFPVEQRALARFAATFLRENCFLEDALTRQARAQHTDPLYVADRYDTGEAVVKLGQVIDEKALAALALLREKIAVGSLQQEVASAHTQADRVSRQNWWLLGSVVGLSGALVLLIAYLSRRRQAMALVPVRVGNRDKLLLVPETAALPEATGDGADGLRGGLAAQLARVLGTRLVQRLFSQRASLLETQRLASAELEEMESRLGEVHAPLRERLQAYEQRIAELEKQLAQKGAENRELLKAKIDLTRRHLETERSRNPAEFN